MNVAPLGYSNARDCYGKGILLIDHDKATIVPSIFKDYLNGFSINEIRKKP